MAKLPSISEEETVEELGPYFFIQKKTGHRLTVDSVLLADFIASPEESDSVIDIGTGSGAIPLMLSYKTGSGNIVGVEIDPESALTAKRNVVANGLASRITIVESDFRELKGVFSEGSFQRVVSNPPYVKTGTGRLSPHRGRDAARSELKGNLADLVEISRHLAGSTGRIYFVFPVRRLFEMLGEVKKAGLNAGRLRFVHTDPKKPAKLFLIEAGRGLVLKTEEPVFLRGPSGSSRP